jgi:hypothetical protein
VTSALVGGEWSASRPCRFTPGKPPFGSKNVVSRRRKFVCIYKEKLFHFLKPTSGFYQLIIF